MADVIELFRERLWAIYRAQDDTTAAIHIENAIEQLKKYGDLQAEWALEDAPNCEYCDRIDPDNPPERDNEGYL